MFNVMAGLCTQAAVMSQQCHWVVAIIWCTPDSQQQQPSSHSQGEGNGRLGRGQKFSMPKAAAGYFRGSPCGHHEHQPQDASNPTVMPEDTPQRPGLRVAEGDVGASGAVVLGVKTLSAMPESHWNTIPSPSYSTCNPASC